MRRKPRRHAPRLGSSARHKSLAGPTRIPDGPKKKAYHGSMQVVGLALSWQFHCVKAARWSKRPCRVGSWGLRHTSSSVVSDALTAESCLFLRAD